MQYAGDREMSAVYARRVSGDAEIREVSLNIREPDLLWADFLGKVTVAAVGIPAVSTDPASEIPVLHPAAGPHGNPASPTSPTSGGGAGPR